MSDLARAAVATSGQGLDGATAAQRLAQFGPNEIEKPRSRNLLAIVRGTLREPMFLLLLAASTLYLVLGDLGEGLFLLCGATLAIGLVVVQEVRSEGALKALRNLAQPFARALRDGEARRIAARDIVPGDLLLVGEGERVPADGVLVSGDVLNVDESLLTGESAPIPKTPTATEVVDPTSTMLAGTMVVQGSGRMLVTHTGPRTRFGEIGASLAKGGEDLTPLQKTSRRLMVYLAIGAVAFSIIVFTAYGVIRNDWLQGGLTALTVAISLLPEEFPMVLAVFLALGAWRLARHNVLVRRSAVIEALGGATMLCVDKTGTLTRNQMKLARAWTAGTSHDLRTRVNASPALRALLDTASLASAATAIDPMDRAIFALSPRSTDEPSATWPLRPERLAVIQVWRRGGADIAAAKGAPETIFRMCRLSHVQIAELQEVIHGMATDGLRVLGVASARYEDGFPADPDAARFEFHGLIGFVDPLREDVAQALTEARGASISVSMITGDHPSTALAIAREAGIDVRPGVLTGGDIDKLAEDVLRQRIKAARVFARISPEQKLRLVEAFKRNGEVVVMTGDGVNDGPALQVANIGIAMGQRGSDVAREASDIVLLDDSFASIVGGVRLGRRIFANLRKALTFITAVHVPLAGLALIPVLLGWPPLFLPMHVVLLELIIDPVCSLVFEAEPSEIDAMHRPPRRSTEALFGFRQVGLAIGQGVVVLVAITIYYGWALTVAPENEARGSAFASLVLSNLLLALANSFGARGGLLHPSHAPFWIISGIAGVVLVALLYAPPLAAILHVAPPKWSVLGPGLLVGSLAGAWWRAVLIARGERVSQRAV